MADLTGLRIRAVSQAKHQVQTVLSGLPAGTIGKVANAGRRQAAADGLSWRGETGCIYWSDIVIHGTFAEAEAPEIRKHLLPAARRWILAENQGSILARRKFQVEAA